MGKWHSKETGKKKKDETFLCLKLQELDKEQYGQTYILWRGAWY